MKKIILAATILFGIGRYAAFAQLRSIPAAVTEAFKNKYPDAEKVEWHDKITVFMASFKRDSIEFDARFNSKGEWQSTEHEIALEDVPAAVTDGFHKSKFADWTLDKAVLIELPGNTFQYRLLVEKSDIQKKNLLFNTDGRLLKDSVTL